MVTALLTFLVGLWLGWLLAHRLRAAAVLPSDQSEDFKSYKTVIGTHNERFPTNREGDNA